MIKVEMKAPGNRTRDDPWVPDANFFLPAKSKEKLHVTTELVCVWTAGCIRSGSVAPKALQRS